MVRGKIPPYPSKISPLTFSPLPLFDMSKFDRFRQVFSFPFSSFPRIDSPIPKSLPPNPLPTADFSRTCTQSRKNQKKLNKEKGKKVLEV